MWILVLKGLKQAIEAHTATAYLGLSTVNCHELFPAQLLPPLPGWDTSPPQHCSQWYVKKKHTKSKTCERRGKVRNSFLTKIKVTVSHKTGKIICC